MCNLLELTVTEAVQEEASNTSSLPVEDQETFPSCLSSPICPGFKSENGLEVSSYVKTQRGELVKSSLNIAGVQMGTKRWKLKI